MDIDYRALAKKYMAVILESLEDACLVPEICEHYGMTDQEFEALEDIERELHHGIYP